MLTETSTNPEVGEGEQKRTLEGKIRDCLKQVFATRREDSASEGQIGRQTKFSDGYMQATIDAGIFTEEEIQKIIREERSTANA